MDRRVDDIFLPEQATRNRNNDMRETLTVCDVSKRYFNPIYGSNRTGVTSTAHPRHENCFGCSQKTQNLKILLKKDVTRKSIFVHERFAKSLDDYDLQDPSYTWPTAVKRQRYENLLFH